MPKPLVEIHDGEQLADFISRAMTEAKGCQVRIVFSTAFTLRFDDQPANMGSSPSCTLEVEKRSASGRTSWKKLAGPFLADTYTELLAMFGKGFDEWDGQYG